MTTFNVYNLKNAPSASAEKLGDVAKAWGFVPNLHGVLAEAPIALQSYDFLFGQFSKSSFTPAEQQVVYLAINYDNNCEYCMAGHSYLATAAGVPAQAIQALRDGERVADGKLEVLRQFVSAVVVNRGDIAEEQTDAFIAAGFSKQQVLEVLVAVATKVISNYTNHIAHTPAETALAQFAWKHPRNRLALAA
jgi:AhpD family alkylhydroperoxidase